MLQYLSVAAGAFAGMLWPFIVALYRSWSPTGPNPRAALAAIPSALPRAAGPLRFLGWLALAAFIAAAVALLNIVPLVTGDAADKLKALGGWQYALLAAEGFGLASFFEEGLKPTR